VQSHSHPQGPGRRRRSLLAASGALALAAAGIFPVLPAHAADAYPSKPIRLIVGFAPGGGTDSAARIVAPHLSEALGQPVIVDNRPGMAGGLALDLEAKAPPDGYTLVLASSGGLTAFPSLYKHLAYDPAKDFAPISLFGISPLVLVANAKLPVNTTAELIALAKKEPGKLSYGSGGTGAATHLSGELFKSLSGTDLLHVPYKGSQPAMLALISGEIPLAFIDLATVMPQLSAKKIKVIGVSGGHRTSVAPELPTVAETGLPGYEADGWFAVLAPAGTPAAVVAKLNAALVASLKKPEVRERFKTAGLETTFSTPEELTRRIQADTDKWSRLIHRYNITAE
jgi:tripartite-type tricarboxylate transporter receptor subunit TctC